MKKSPLLFQQRSMRRVAAFVLSAALHVAVVPAHAATPPVTSAASVAVPGFEVSEIKIISPEPGRYYSGWPTVALLRNGNLVVAYSGSRDAHVCPFGQLELMFSLNQGATWSWPRVAWDSGIDDRDGGVMETAKGTLLLTSFKSIGFSNPDRRPRYAQDDSRWDRYAQGFAGKEWIDEQGPFILRSEDGGRNWSPAMSLPVNSPHGPIQLADRRLLYPGIEGVGKGAHIKPGERKAGVWESLDDGRTWKLLSVIPTRPGDDPTDYHELHGVEAANGTVVVQIRSHSDGANKNKRLMLQTESRDGGKTWSVPRDIGVAGYPPHLLRLKDDRLMMTYDSRALPFGVAARISSDHGTTWSGQINLTSYDKKRDQGYASTVQFSDGSLLTVWYEVMPESKKAVLRQAKWSLR